MWISANHRSAPWLKRNCSRIEVYVLTPFSEGGAGWYGEVDWLLWAAWSLYFSLEVPFPRAPERLVYTELCLRLVSGFLKCWSRLFRRTLFPTSVDDRFPTAVRIQVRASDLMDDFD